MHFEFDLTCCWSLNKTFLVTTSSIIMFNVSVLMRFAEEEEEEKEEEVNEQTDREKMFRAK